MEYPVLYTERNIAARADVSTNVVDSLVECGALPTGDLQIGSRRYYSYALTVKIVDWIKANYSPRVREYVPMAVE